MPDVRAEIREGVLLMSDYINHEGMYADLQDVIQKLESVRGLMPWGKEKLDSPITTLKTIEAELIDHMSVGRCYGCNEPLLPGEVKGFGDAILRVDGGADFERLDFFMCMECARRVVAMIEKVS